MANDNPGKTPCDHSEDKLQCCHSNEAILLILSRTPWRLSIKELSDITRFHRNTVSRSVSNLKKEGKIKSSGDSKSPLYYYGGVADFYRRQAKAIADLKNIQIDWTEESVKTIAKKIGYNLIKNVLDEAMDDGPEFKHDNLFEALLHVKMAYPFTDITVDKNGRAKSTIAFTVVGKPKPNDFNLRIHTCLCNENKGDKASVACVMVEGALEGAIKGACGIDSALVEWTGSGFDDKHGSFCQYRIVTKMEETMPEKQISIQKSYESIIPSEL